MRHQPDFNHTSPVRGFGPRGRGPFGPDLMERGHHRGGPRHGGRGDGRRARRGDIRLAILQLIAEEPANGYGLIAKIAERTDDRWRPSPGSIYPVLQLLVEEGFASREEGEQGLYSITEAGREYLMTHTEQAQQVWDNGRGETESEEQMRECLHRLMGAAREVSINGTEDQRTRASALLDDARRQLYGILSE